MGPQSEDCGNPPECYALCGRMIGFNGAAVRRLRKQATCSPVCASCIGFNGAAVRRLRKPNRSVAGGIVSEWLQWGRSPKTAETFTSAAGRRFYVLLQWGRSPKTAETAREITHSNATCSRGVFEHPLTIKGSGTPVMSLCGKSGTQPLDVIWFSPLRATPMVSTSRHLSQCNQLAHKRKIRY
jgi:hypothetical protein